MDPAPIRRWNPGFIALRWCHLFWALPLLGLLAGLVMHFLPMVRSTATGVVQIRPGGGMIRAIATSLPLFTPSDVVHIVRSDDVLRQTALALDLPIKWRMEEDKCVAKLRNAIRCDEIHRTALIEISVSGRHRAESEMIWNALIDSAKDHFRIHQNHQNHQNQATLDLLEAQVKLQKADVDSKREILSDAIRTESRFTKSKADFEISQKQLEQLQIKEISARMLFKVMEDPPLIIHQAPGTPVPVTLWDTLRPLVLHSCIGLGSGMALAVAFAYLLELMVPRKTPAT